MNMGSPEGELRPAISDNELIQFAIDYQKKGQRLHAAELYQEVLRRVPIHRRALYMYGCLVQEDGQHEIAIDLFRRALAVSPKDPDLCCAVAKSLIEVGRYEEADVAIRRAIQLRSRPEYHLTLGVVREKQERIPEALSAFRHALKQNPVFADALYHLGTCYRLTGDLGLAATEFERALHVDPKHVPALTSLARIFRSLGRGAEIVPHLQRALSQAPGDPILGCAVGDIYQDGGAAGSAAAAYRNAIASDPSLAHAWYKLGCAETTQREYVSAIEAFQEALRLAPNWSQAEHNLGRARYELGQANEAMAHFRNCVVRDDLALSRAMAALIAPGVPREDNASILAIRRTWADRDLPKAVKPDSGPAPSRNAGRPIRIGYISSFFHRQNWMKPVWGLINQHDRSAFEIHLFSSVPASSIHAGYHPDARDHFHNISGSSNEEVSTLIRQLEIDILVDLNSYSDLQRLPLFMSRPAPAVVGWFNLYATSGMIGFDYLIGDDQVIPAEEECFYTEAILRIPGSYLTFEVNYPVPDVVDPPCTRNGQITFGSMASQIKITSDVVEAWSSILSRSPNSRLIVRNGALAAASSREFLLDLFSKNDVSRDRIQLKGPVEHFQFLKTYDEIDIALDTFPYNGGTTTTEAVWQGVPVVTFWGDRWASRTSASILRAGGLDEFVRTDIAAYISFAAELANSPETPQRLVSLRKQMRGQLLHSPVCDIKSFARGLERLYGTIFTAS